MQYESKAFLMCNPMVRWTLVNPGGLMYVTAIKNAVSTQSRQQTPKMLTNNTASSIECPHSPVLID